MCIYAECYHWKHNFGKKKKKRLSSHNYLTINPQRHQLIKNDSNVDTIIYYSLPLPSTTTPGEGLESDPHRSKRNGAWGAVLGTAVAVAFVGLVAYVILKRKHQKGFTHRKLVEEYPSDPGT